MIKDRRLGKFRVPNHLITDDHLRGIVQQIMCEVVVLEANYSYPWGGVVYLAISDHFDYVDFSVEPPMYNILYDEVLKDFHSFQRIN